MIAKCFNYFESIYCVYPPKCYAKTMSSYFKSTLLRLDYRQALNLLTIGICAQWSLGVGAIESQPSQIEDIQIDRLINSSSLSSGRIDEESKVIQQVVRWLGTNQHEALKNWVSAHPLETRRIQKTILSDLLFTSMYQLPASFEHSKELLLQLNKLAPNPEQEPYINWIKGNKLLPQIEETIIKPRYLWFAEDSSLDGADPEYKQLIEWAAYFKYSPDLFAKRKQEQPSRDKENEISSLWDPSFLKELDHRIVFEKRVALSRIEAWTDTEFQDSFQALAYRMLLARAELSSPKDLQEFIQLSLEASQKGYPGLRIWGLINLGSSISSLSPAEKIKLLHVARQESQERKFNNFSFLAELMLAQVNEEVLSPQTIQAKIEALPVSIPTEALRYYVISLQGHAFSKALPYYQELLKSDNPILRMSALQVLNTNSEINHELIKLAQTQLTTQDPIVRAYAAQILLAHDHTPLQESRVDLLLDDPSWQMQAVLLQYGNKLEPSAYNDLLIDALKSEQPQVQIAAIEALRSHITQSKQTDYSPDLATYAKNGSRSIKMSILRYLRTAFQYKQKETQSEQSRAIVRDLLSDKDSYIRYQTLSFLGPDLQSQNQAPELWNRLREDPNSKVRQQIQILDLIQGTQENSEAFVELFKQPWFPEQNQLYVKYLAGLESGQYSWKVWEKAILEANSALQESLLKGILESSKQYPEHLLRFLEKNVNKFSIPARMIVLQNLNHAPSPALVQQAAKWVDSAKHPQLKELALYTLSQSAKPEYVTLFLSLLKEPDPQLAYLALNYFKKSEHLEPLYRLAKQSSQELSDPALALILDTHLRQESSLTPPMKRAIAQRSIHFQKSLLQHWVKLEMPDIPQILIQTAFQSQDAEHILAAAAYTKERPNDFQASDLFPLLQSSNPDIQAMALQLAAIKKSPNLYPTILPLFNSLKSVSHARYVVLPTDLEYDIEDQASISLNLAFHALTALVNSNRQLAQPLLLKSLNASDPKQRLYALLNLNHFDIPKIQIKNLCSDPNLQVRFQALELTEIYRENGYRTVDQPLLQPIDAWLPFLKDPDPELRQRALEWLGKYPELNYEQILSPLEADPDPEIKQKIAELKAKYVH